MNKSTTLEANTVVLEKIRTKREAIHAYIKIMEPRSKKLTNIAIICGAISAALTAAPALGGKSLSSWLTDAFKLELPVWQLLCLGAMICSIAATISVNMSKSHESTERIMRAQACDAKLEGLETLMEIGTIDTKTAADQYNQALQDIPYI